MNRADLERELERLHPLSYGWALGCCRRNRDDAQEVLQTVYMKILEGKARFDGRSSLKTWLFAVIRRTAGALARRKWLGRIQFWGADPPEILDPADGADSRFERSQATAFLLAALDRLSRRQREMMELVFYHDLSVEEAAAVLGISAGSARVHYHRGKKQLMTLLAREECA